MAILSRMNKYELSVVLDSKATAAKKKAFVEKLTKMVELAKGKLGKMEDFGEKAYGILIMFPLELGGAEAKSLLTKVRLDEDVKRQLMVKVK